MEMDQGDEVVPNSTAFTDYQRRMWYSLSQGAVSRFYHERVDGGIYVIRKIGWIPLTFYWTMWINTTVKVRQPLFLVIFLSLPQRPT